MTHTEYGLFVWHGSAEILHRTFSKAEMVGAYRLLHPELVVSSVRKRTVTIGEWTAVA